MFKASLPLTAIQKAFIFAGSAFRINILAVGKKGAPYTVSKRRFSTKGKGLYVNKITGSIVFCTTTDGTGDYDLIFKD